jgi:dTDP-4-dehydrorhamnose 3,5-epimerase
MEVITTSLEGLLLIKPKVFEDPRGYFFESYNEEVFRKAGINCSFFQDNQSLSESGVLRGLHFQKPPFAQAKLVRVIKGAVLDVAVDIRKNSPTYGQHEIIEINETNKWMIYIPEGFAHGFLTLKNDTIFFYKCSSGYMPSAEDSISWNDKDLNINWGINTPTLSAKDKQNKPFKSFSSPF